MKGVGASLGASFLFSSFYDSVAVAAPGRKAKRILVFFTMGTAPEIWKPTSVSGESPTYSDDHCMKPLDEVKQHLVILDGLPSGSPSNNHGSADGLTGMGYFSNGPYGLISVDQYIVKKLEEAGDTSLPRFLLCGANIAANGKTGFYNGTNLVPTASPVSAFREAFRGFVPTTTTTSGGNPDAALEDMLRRRKSILDNLKGEIATMKRDLGKEQYYKLDRHLESIRQLEQELAGQMDGGGSVVTGGACAPTEPGMDLSDHITGNPLHLDIIVNAFACNRTRVASVQWGTDQEMRVAMPEIGVPDEQHNGLIHGNDPGHARLIKLERWLAEQFVGVIKKLKATPEPDGSGTLFDNTLVAWCRDMGDAPAHNQQEMKFVLAMGDGGYLKTASGGRFIKSSERHERVLLSMIDAMGITDFSGFGDPALGAKSPLPGIAAT
ncbi:DUF1552 domain-containing protein [Sorangium sp. So ce131]|uniref:DUF1552 domain-containing protein n=1 Tax=Sorangium sp. So ce131 TaxID=3133282 RepID=UPI003F5D8963